MKQKLPNSTYSELFKICYNLSIIIGNNNNNYKILDYYEADLLRVHSLPSKKYLYALRYMENLKELTIVTNEFQYIQGINSFRLFDYIPNLKKLTFDKE
jgi:hypothetical protein